MTVSRIVERVGGISAILCHIVLYCQNFVSPHACGGGVEANRDGRVVYKLRMERAADTLSVPIVPPPEVGELQCLVNTRGEVAALRCPGKLVLNQPIRKTLLDEEMGSRPAGRSIGFLSRPSTVLP
jgi:hypothetical protein